MGGVLPSIVMELKAIDVFLGPGDGRWVTPAVGPEAEQAAWEELWAALDCLRMLVARPEAWEKTFEVCVAGLLSWQERLAQPGERERVVWVTSDATLELQGAIDWTHRRAVRRQTPEDYRVLRERADMEAEQDEVIIAIDEFMIVICLATGSGEAWKGKVGDPGRGQ